MTELATDDLRPYAHLANNYLDTETWAPIHVYMVAIELLRSRQSVTECVARLVDHDALEHKAADIMRGGDVVDSGLNIYWLT